MRDRASTFSNPELIALLRERFVPVALDCWDYRRAKGPGGEFFRSFAVPAQLNRVNDDGNRSLQGHYVVDPSGKLLAAHNRRGAKALRKLTQRALAAFKPSEWSLPKLDVDRLGRTPPKGAQILNVYTRVDDWSEALQGSPNRFQRDQMTFNREATGLDHLWITRGELDVLLAPKFRPGERWDAPASLARRLARFHFVDNVRGEPPHYRRSEIQLAELSLCVLSMSAEGWVTVGLAGTFVLDAQDHPRYPRYFRGGLEGQLEYHMLSGRLRRLDLLTEGETLGGGRYTPGAPKGAYRLRVACELPPDGFAVDVPPQGSRSRTDYLLP